MSEFFLKGDSLFVCVDRHVPIEVGTILDGNVVHWNDYALEHADLHKWTDDLQKKFFEFNMDHM